MFKILSLKILIYGFWVVKTMSFLVEKRAKVLDHELNPTIDGSIEMPQINHNIQVKKGTITKDQPVSNFNQNKVSNTPKNPSDVINAVSKLEELEKQLQIYPENFIDHRETIKNQIQSNILQSESDYERLHQKLSSIENTSPNSIKKILEWMKVKKKEIDLYKEDLKLIEDISLIVTKLEAAKYISLNNINNQNYYENPYHSFVDTSNYYYNPYQYDRSSWYYPYSYNSNYYQNTIGLSPTYYNNEQSKYDIFNRVLNKYINGYRKSQVPALNVDRSFDKGYQLGSLKTISKNNQYSTDNSLGNSFENVNTHSKIYYPQSYSNNVNSNGVQNSMAYTKSNVSGKSPSKVETSTEDTQKAVEAINYLQDKLGLDTMSVLKLMSELKESTKNEMNFHKKQLQNNLLEYKRSSIAKPSVTVSKRSHIASSEKAFLESRDKYWLIKQVEWFITRLEAAKYAAMSKIIV